MDYLELSELIKKTRSVRRFKSGVTIAADELEEVVDAARFVSSALNKQPLRYVVVTESGLVNEISAKAKWASHLEDWDQSESERPSAYIILVNDTTVDGYPMIDTGIVFQAVILLLNAKGYAGCALASIDKDHCRERFSLPDNLEPVIGIAVGVSNEVVDSVPVVEGDTNYYRVDDVHCVPKRSLDEVLLGSF